LFQLMSHAIFKAALFMAAGVLIHTTGTKYANEMGGLKDKMKLTMIVFLIASAALAGIPPLTGFWSKDAVLATAWDSGQFGLFVLGAATAGITAFYAFRLFGLIFYGKKSAHLEEREMEGHIPHETDSVGWLPYAILGGATALIGILVPILNLPGLLQSAAATYVRSFFPTATAVSGAAVPLKLVPAGIALAFVVIGVVAAWTIYVANKVSPAQLIREKGVMHGLYMFLENRWYINAIYYRVFVNPTIRFAQWTLDNIEDKVLSKINIGGVSAGINLSIAGNWVDNIVDTISNGFSSVGQAFSRVARRMQTGILEQYTMIFAIGVVIMLLIFIFTLGVGLL
jgi:NADH-quinone oxidoreductase subunit L